MQKFTTIILLFALHAQPLTNGVIFLDFLWHQDYIKEFLCINKERPELSCNGKCQLSKQLSQTQSEEQKQWPHLINTKYEFLLSTIYEFQKKLPFVDKEPINAMYSKGYHKLFTVDIFHPPQRPAIS